jgi:hypothetical protein
MLTGTELGNNSLDPAIWSIVATVGAALVYLVYLA